MKTAVASADDEGPKKKFGVGLPKKPSKGTYGLKPDKDKNNDDYGHFTKKVLPKASKPANPDNPKGPVNNKMKVVPLKEKTIAHQEREKAKAKEKLKGKGTNGKKTNGKK